MSDATPAPGSMEGKTCLITGATSGLGAVAADALAHAGARVIVVGRDKARCDESATRLRSLGGADSFGIAADLSNQAYVRRLADEVRNRVTRLDVLLNNAGAMFAERTETVDGVEKTWALNHLGYFLLTNLLIEPLKAAGSARVVSVASDAHRAAFGIDFDDPEMKRRKYRPFRAYAQSKLANILFAFELARRLEGTGVTSNCLHPGFVATSFFNGRERMFRLMKLAAWLVALTPEKGARTSIYLASSPDVTGVSGRYFERCRPAKPARPANDPEAARRLWDLSAGRTRLVESA
ncbi:MAG: SDR family oxidoreductase [Isosphaeraceae bacterium]